MKLPAKSTVAPALGLLTLSSTAAAFKGLYVKKTDILSLEIL